MKYDHLGVVSQMRKCSGLRSGTDTGRCQVSGVHVCVCFSCAAVFLNRLLIVPDKSQI